MTIGKRWTAAEFADIEKELLGRGYHRTVKRVNGDYAYTKILADDGRDEDGERLANTSLHLEVYDYTPYRNKFVDDKLFAVMPGIYVHHHPGSGYSQEFWPMRQDDTTLDYLEALALKFFAFVQTEMR